MRPLLKGATLYGSFVTAGEMPALCRKQLHKTGLPAWERKNLDFILDFLGPESAIVQKSSGTTGISKEIRIDKEAMIRSASLTASALGLRKDQVAMLCLPVDYIAGKMMIVRALVTGMKLRWTEPASLPDVPADENFDFCAMVPLQVYNLLENGFTFSRINTLIIGGSALPPGLECRLKVLPCRFFETFGMAETCSHIALRRINGQGSKPWFTVLPGIKISADERGCLVIRTPFLPDPVVTNDVVEIMGNKTFRWKGRVDHVINSGGIKISPEELETMIHAVLGQEWVVVGLPDKRLGHKLVAATSIPYPGEEKSRALAKLKSALPAYHVPADVVCLDFIPRNRSFKIDRRALLKKVENIIKKTG